MNNAQKKLFKQQAHSLKPVVMTGANGLTPAVHQEIETALEAHELIKIKLVANRDERKVMADEIIAEHGAELVQTIGQMLVIYKENPKN